MVVLLEAEGKNERKKGRKNKMKTTANDVSEAVEAEGNLQDVIELLANMRKNREVLYQVWRAYCKPKKSLPCAKGGGKIFDFDGGIVKI